MKSIAKRKYVRQCDRMTHVTPRSQLIPNLPNGLPQAGQKVLARKGSAIRQRGIVGHFIGGCRRCSLDGCRGHCYSVRWTDGKLTWLCSRALVARKHHWELL